MSNLLILKDHFLGRHSVGDIIDLGKLMSVATEYQPSRILWLTQIPNGTGIFKVSDGQQDYLICRTKIGYFIPSFYKLATEEPVKLIPHPIRYFGGFASIVLIALGVIAFIGLGFEDLTLGVLGFLFVSFFTLFMIAFFEIEKRMVMFGFIIASKR